MLDSFQPSSFQTIGSFSNNLRRGVDKVFKDTRQTGQIYRMSVREKQKTLPGWRVGLYFLFVNPEFNSHLDIDKWLCLSFIPFKVDNTLKTALERPTLLNGHLCYSKDFIPVCRIANGGRGQKTFINMLSPHSGRFYWLCCQTGWSTPHCFGSLRTLAPDGCSSWGLSTEPQAPGELLRPAFVATSLSPVTDCRACR
jgi:hypothetical protein